MSGPLTGKVALVTGASRGIGRATAIELGSAGATVYVTARSMDTPVAEAVPGTVQETAAAIDAAGGAGIAVQCDHADDDQAQAVIDRIQAEHRGLDILVNNVFPSPEAAQNIGPGWGGAPFWETPAASWHAFFEISVRGHYIITQKAMPLLLERQGLIIGISSCGAVNYFMNPLYGAGKAAGDRLMRDMALELADYPVSIMHVWPGIVRTEITGAMFDQAPQMLACLLREGWAPFATGAEDLAALSTDDMVALCETTTFAARAVTALASDPDVRAKHGRAIPVALLSDEYGFTDADGRSPDAFRFRETEAWNGFTPAAKVG